jgi:Ca-activated chloride channel family protein
MRKAAHFGRGSFTYVGSTSEVSEQMENLFRKLESPALAEIEVWWEDEAAEFYPSRMPDLYVGEPLILTALLPNGPGGVELTGSSGASSWETSLSVCSAVEGNRPPCSPPLARGDDRTEGLSEGEDVCPPSLPRRGSGGGNSTSTCSASNLTGDFLGDFDLPAPDTLGIAKLWARRKIDLLMDSLVEGVDRQTVRDAVVALGLEHHLVTQYTSLVAVDVTPTSPLAGGETRNVPANAPYGSAATLPRTATPAALYGLIALLLFAVALVLRPNAEMRCER